MTEVEVLIPDLRFPEFLNDKTWVRDTLGALSNVISKRNKENKNLPVYSINNKEGFLPQDDQFEGISSTERNYDISLYKVIERNTFAYNPARINVGSIGYSGDLDNIIISSLYVCFKTTEKVNDEFLLQFIKTPFFNKEVENNVEGGIRNYLFYQNFSNISIPIPSLQEQQKIASCLSSLDELIAANKDKLTALKVHKKGLMQNLFPHPSTGSGSRGKVPKYRFPEFEEDGEWVEKKVGEMTIKVGSGKTPQGGDKNYISSGRPFVRSQNIGWGILLLDEIAFIAEEIHATFRSSEIKLNDVLLNITGASIGRSAIANEKIAKGNVNQHVCIIRTKHVLNPVFLNKYFISNYGQKQIDGFQAGGNRQGLNFSQIRSLEIPIPQTIQEQQKIASCLSSVDELITTQAEKIAELQQHKKGLMQGLFPKIKN
ncbi:Restriction endonuclease S subunit [Cyclobacterium xiamenense]|uniref:Restriction endonuclease S subunit n=1 Tax=Cyclobacterium xiamenense TaxID=1297121 RepID=A0A1H6WI32_9BACT|nr:restriction endonuclease subunit S [Cyclobacterium xiamenense]SEJ16681.1 Restriction endonuclease S subunit [Cyclobacterium xiamenense]